MMRFGQATRSFRGFAGIVGATLVLFRLFELALSRLGALPAAAYERPFFMAAVPARWVHVATQRVPWWLAAVAIVGAAFVVALLMRRRREVRQFLEAVFAGWDVVEDGRALRLFVMGVTGITTYALSGYPRNPYFHQLHLADRLLLVVLWLAIAWRPMFAIPYAVAAAAIAGQFVVPLGFISWTEMSTLLQLPLLLGAFWLVRAMVDARRSDALLFCWCCLIAAVFWASGLDKLRVGWLGHPHVALLTLGAHANGWLSYIGTEQMLRVAQWHDRLALPLMLTTLLLECGALVLLWRRMALVGFLALAILFHAGVAATTGIVFWKWMLADVFLLLFLLRGNRGARLQLFTPRRFALSVVLIFSSPWWLKSESLMWFDTPLTYTVRVEATDSRGIARQLPAGFFRPYSDAFALGTFSYLSHHAQLTGPMGVTRNRRLADALVAARSPEAVFALEQQFGASRFDSAATATFDEFVTRMGKRARCAAERDPLLLRLVGAPRHLWTHPLEETLPCGDSLVSIRVFERTTFYDGTRHRVIRERLLRELPLR